MPAPIIDMHLHAGPANAQGPPPVRICAPFQRMVTRDPRQSTEEYATALRQRRGCSVTLVSAGTDAELLDRTLDVLRRRNIYAVTSGSWDWVQRWHAADPDRIIRGLGFHVYNAPFDSVRQLVETGQLRVLGEVMNQFVGVAPGDSLFEPYLDLAEARDIPVGIHVGPGPPGAFYLGAKGYRASLARPLLLEEALIRHPKLRIYVMHAGWPMLDEMLLMLHSHPQLHVDLGIISFALPRGEFHSYLRRLVQAGFVERIMFGSDQMVWPQAIERAIDAVESAPFLSPEQKRDIFYNNAARFLRLTEDEVARHHGPRTRRTP
jgi:predicted TIM-barrel fold metal-dependent hydrolase